MPLCDTLLRCAEEPPLYSPAWSDETLVEIRRTMLKFGHSATKADRRIASMRSAFPGATIHVPSEAIEKTPELPDPKDRHVLAAAIQSEADGIVTLNLRHFPSTVLEKLGISAQSPDGFLSDLLRLHRQDVVSVLDAQARAIGEERAGILRRLRKIAPDFVELAEATNE